MAQLVKWLPCRHKKPSLIPRTLTRHFGTKVHICNWGGRDRQDPALVASQSTLLGKSFGNAVSKDQVDDTQGMTVKFNGPHRDSVLMMMSSPMLNKGMY